MKKNFKKFLSVFLVVVMLVGIAPLSGFIAPVEASASSATYNKEYYYSSGMKFMTSFAVASIRTGSSKTPLTDNGYSISGDYGSTDIDLNDGAGGYYVRIGYQMGTSEASAIRGIAFYNGSNPPSTYTYNGILYKCCNVGWSKTKLTGSASATSSPLDLNVDAGGDYIYLFYTTDPNAGAPMTNIDYETGSTTNDSGSVCQTPAVWLNGSLVGQTANLNEGAGGTKIYFFYKQTGTEVDTSALHSAITTADNLLANSSRYTSETVTALQNAVNSGKSIVNDYNADGLSCNYNQSAIDTAKNNINNAIAELCTMIYFDGNGGTVSLASTPITIGGNSTWTYNGDYSDFSASRTGYTFKGWSTSKTTSPTDTGNYFPVGGSSISGGFNTTFYAVWEANKYTVVFDNLFDFTKFKINTGELEVNERTDSGFTVTSTAGSGADANTGFSYAIPVEPGKTYVLSADIAIEMPNGVNKGYDIYINTLDANQTGETTATPDTSNGAHREGDVYISLTGQTENNSNAYIRFTAGANTEYIKFRFDANNADNKLTVKNIRFCEDGTSYVAPITVTYGSTYGTLPTPTKPSHQFLGWYKEDGTQLTASDTVNITDTLFVTSKWKQTGYTVKWVNYDGTVLETDTNVAAGATPKYDGANPVKPATNYYTYEFTGWSPALSSVTGDVTYTAQFKETEIKYTITWVIDGKTETQEYKYGETPAHADPVKAGNAQYTYTFTGWEPAIATVTGNATYTAKFSQTTNKYTVIWKNWDGAVLETDTVDYGTENKYNGAEPTKPGNAQYTYTFTGWAPATAGTVTENITYVAQFKETVNTYTIKFVNEDGSTIQSGKVAYGEMPVAPTVVYKAADNYYTYEFAGWDNEIVNVTGDATYKATFTPIERKYTIKWTFADGSVTTDELGYEAAITAPANSEAQAPDAGYHYSYVWSPAVAGTVTGNANYKEELIATAHNWTDWAETKTPTCADEGAEERHCTVCNYTETQAKDKLAHTPADAIEENRVESTCTVAGSYDSVVYCSVCNAKISSEKIDLPLAQHTEGQPNVENNVAPDCENGGSYDIVKYCTECNAELSRETVTVDPLGHTEGAVQVENEVEVTCTTDGSYDNVVYCTKCDKELSRETIVIKAEGHKNSEVQVENKVEATCTTDGSYDNVVYCTVCNEELSRETIVETAPGHTEGAVVKENIKDATCTENGSYEAVIYCTVCNAEVSRTPTTIDALGHTPAEAVEENRVESTCVVRGSYDSVVYCSVCNGELSRNKVTLDLADHKPAVSVEENRTESTCTVNGSYDSVIYCSVCDYEIERTKITLPLAEHTPAAAVEENRVESTCTVAGSYDEVVYCDKCNAELSRETKDFDLAAHTPGEVKVENNVEPDCENTGSYDNVVYCSACNAELSRETETVDALGHKAKEAARENYVPATCSKDGSYDMVVRCETCNEILSSESFVEKATGDHVYATEKDRVDATCTDDGYVIMACGCGEAEEKTVLPATGHKAAEAVKENEDPATCTEAGSYESVVYCSVCNEELSRNTETVAALGHSPADAVEENRVESTCTVAGSYDSVVYCSVCDAELSRNTIDLPLAEHTPADAVEEGRVESTCTVAGSYDSVVYCSVCNGELSRETLDLPLAEHTPAEAVKENNVDASCMVNGSYQMAVYCSECNKELSRTNHVNVAPGHKPADAVIENTVDATCTKKGSYDETVYCSVCSEKLSSVTKEIPVVAHTPAEAVEENRTEPTCKVPGSYDSVVYCSVCNDVLSRETHEISVVAHTPKDAVEENRTESTCTVAGSYDSVVYCSVCNDVLSRDTITLPLADHTEGEAVTEKDVKPDCVNDGSYDTVVYCTVCNEELSRETTTVPALGHTEGEAVTEKDVKPDCVNDGSYDTVVYCTVCNEELSRETTTVPALGHTEGEATVENEVKPDCVNTGSYEKVVNCTVCGEELARETIIVDALGHTKGEAVKENEVFGSCLEGGSYDEVFYCTVCGEEISREKVYVAVGTHTPGAPEIENRVVASCIIPSSYDEVVYCTVCGEEISRNTVTGSTIAHKPDKIVKENVKEATCIRSGSYDNVVYCGVCYTELNRTTVDTGAKGHTIVVDKAVESTCTQTGKTVGSHCSVCNVIIVAQTVVPARGHDLVVDRGYEPTCTRTGLTDGSHCIVCDLVAEKQEEIPALGHLDENGDGICDIDGRDVTDMDPDYGIEVGPDGDGGNHNKNECSICGREHINFFSEIICLIYKILRIFGYKVK